MGIFYSFRSQLNCTLYAMFLFFTAIECFYVAARLYYFTSPIMMSACGESRQIDNSHSPIETRYGEERFIRKSIMDLSYYPAVFSDLFIARLLPLPPDGHLHRWHLMVAICFDFDAI